MNQSYNLYKKAKRIIPGGTQLLSKRPEMFLPGLWPVYYERAKGCQVWDIDGRQYIDMSYMGFGSCILGYADDDVNKAVISAIYKSNMCTLNSPQEVELAEDLIKLHPWAKMVRYARTGGEAIAIAVRIARAATGKDSILFCGYHGWHDWYLSANIANNKMLDGHLLPGLSPNGVPRLLKGTSYAFNYNDIKMFKSLISKYRARIGAVVMEPIRSYYPEKGFLEGIREVTRDLGIVLIFDEITAGWRLNTGGAHLIFNIEPDLAVFGKGISNGFPMAAVIGIKNVMEAAQDTFISSTYWTENIGPTAALATLKKIKKYNISENLKTIGRRIQEGWRAAALKHNINIEISGIYPLGHFSFKHDKSLALKTLFTQLMLEKGFLATTAFYASYAHKDIHIERYLDAVDRVFSVISAAIEKGNIEKYLKGPVCHSGFKRLI